MNYLEIERKWQQKWQQDKLYAFDTNSKKPKYSMLEMFSYPSSSSLHLGHWYNFGLSDSYARYKRMQGFNVFHPMGFDSFGLPAENYAIKTGIHPKISTENNIKIMKEQINNMGGTFDWNYEVVTSRENYYKWTQWLFLQLYDKGLAYQKFAPVNYCTGCKTVLANEQVIDGKCDRCKSEVIKRQQTQWFFKITDYAEKLLAGLEAIDWPEKTKIAQTNWIGKSTGAEVEFKVENKDEKIRVFTSRVDTIFGVTFLVLAPELDLVKKITTAEQSKEVEEYVAIAGKKDDIERQSGIGEKTGVFTGSYCINPLTGKKVPIFIGDYVLASYATGAVMGVAAHDERDFEFAKKKGLEIEEVIRSEKSETVLPFCEDGIVINSGKFSNIKSKEAREKITEELISLNAGNFKVNYRLRDWSVGRQRYWGCPIPMIHCEHCGIVPVPKKDLPVVLPDDVDWTPDGISPLAKNNNFVEVVCPVCGKMAKREVDTLDTFVDSSFYQIRYPNANNDKEFCDKTITNKLLPIDKYVGGFEHATMHLIYSRFITMFLHDIGEINFSEPFSSLVHQGMILGSDGTKMSKSKGNTVTADDIIKEYGSDCLRMYLMFGFNYIEGGAWNDDGLKGIIKFMGRLERAISAAIDGNNENENKNDEAEKELEYILNTNINTINADFEQFSFNTSVAKIMEIVNAMYKYDCEAVKNKKLQKEVAITLIKLLAPITPHFSEELWQLAGQKYSVHNENYPIADVAKMQKQTVKIAVQINNKIVDEAIIKTSATDTEIETQILALEKVKNLTNEKTFIKSIIVKNRLINLIFK